MAGPAAPVGAARRRAWRAAVVLIAAGGLLALGAPGVATAAPPDTAPRVVGGGPATRAWPFYVALVQAGVSDDYQAQFCGGSLIDPEWVLTAAHCTEGAAASDIEVLVGVSNLEAAGPRARVVQIVNHPNYGTPTVYANDVALLRLAEPILGAPVLAMAGPGDTAAETPGTPAALVGFGGITADQSNQQFPTVLYEATMPVLSDAACIDGMVPFGAEGELDFATMICAGVVGTPPTPGIDACQGDSGGPLMVEQAGGSWLQIGIVSWGPTCGYSPTAYSRVSALRAWIEEQTGGTPQPPGVTRVGGTDRYETAALLATAAFTNPGIVYVATGVDPADALSAGPAAAAAGGPVVLTAPDALPPATAQALTTLQPGVIRVVGGPLAVSEAVVTELRTYAPVVERVAGDTRYGTAVAVVATFAGAAPPQRVLVASGDAAYFTDALAGGAAAAVTGDALLLTRTATVPAEVLAYLTELAPQAIEVVGTTAAVSDAVVAQLQAVAPTTRIVGADNYDTAALVMATAMTPGAAVVAATGERFPDALAAAPLRRPLAMVPTTGAVPATLAGLMAASTPSDLLVVGGTQAVSEAMVTELVALMPLV